MYFSVKGKFSVNCKLFEPIVNEIEKENLSGKSKLLKIIS